MTIALTRRRAAAGLAALAASALGAPAVRAQQVLKLTVASSHPVSVPWVGLMNTLFVPEVTRRVQALGQGHRIEWREAYGGQLYKMNATLSSVQQGITDIGWVFHNLEASRLPLQQFGTVTPFTTDDVRLVLDVVNDMHEQLPALRQEWERHNTVFLGATGVDTYHLYTKVPIASYDDLKGRKISAPGSIGLWLKGSGAVPVDGSLTSYYTDIQTGVSEGAISIATGILPNKIYEVAPYITTVNIGALYTGALAINKDSLQALPPEVRKIVADVGRAYSRELGTVLMQRYEQALSRMVEVGARQTPPVRLVNLSAGERERWVRGMPNIAAEWARSHVAKGPTRQIVRTYMDALRKRGARPARNWDAEL